MITAMNFDSYIFLKKYVNKAHCLLASSVLNKEFEPLLVHLSL